MKQNKLIDNSAKYIEMSEKFYEKHPEFLENWVWDNHCFVEKDGEKWKQPDGECKKIISHIGDYIFSLEGVVDVEDGFKKPEYKWNEIIPILTINDWISIFNDDINTLSNLYTFMFNNKNIGFFNVVCEKRRKQYESFEQMLLGMYAFDKYNEFWNGKEWSSSPKMFI